jgi:hypothetical protein
MGAQVFSMIDLSSSYH